MDSLTDLYIDRWTDRQTDGKTNIYIYIRCLYEPEMMFASITGGGEGWEVEEMS